MQTSYRKVKQYNNIGDVDHGAQALTYSFITILRMDMRFCGDKFKPKLCRVAKTVATLAKHISASSTIHEKASTWQMVGNAAKLRLISFKPVSE